MSSQGLNAGQFNAGTHYVYVPPNPTLGLPIGFRLQDSSDYTNQHNQQKIYSKQNPMDQSNSTRLKLKFARQICTNCHDGPFPV
jgi:hypothetical protein